MKLAKLNDYMWEIPRHGGMRVPGLVFASEQLLQKIRQDKTLQQVANVAHLPGIIKHAMAMPDAHQGYGFPVGGVAAFDKDEGIISPGGVGYDINCRVRLLSTNFSAKDIEGSKQALVSELFRRIPVGVGRSHLKLAPDELAELSEKGAQWAVDNGFGNAEDKARTEENGFLKADYSKVSNTAKQRGINQIGTLGSGNHFVEIQKVDQIFNPKIAAAFGLKEPGQVTVMIHCGSRGFGHQIATDYISRMEQQYGTGHLPDRELACGPIQEQAAQDYYRAMCAALNFAFVNRQVIAQSCRDAFKAIMGNDEGMEQVYDVAHNLAKFEKHKVDGEQREVCIHRKGATRSFGPERGADIPEAYSAVGQPVLIPGSMGTASYVLVGSAKAEELTFGSTAHGAGRLMSRAEAKRRWKGEDIQRELASRGIVLKAQSWRGVAEEAYGAYKDVDEVAKTSNAVGIGKLVARLVPVGVIKG